MVLGRPTTGALALGAIAALTRQALPREPAVHPHLVLSTGPVPLSAAVVLAVPVGALVVVSGAVVSQGRLAPLVRPAGR